jgi:hypothetical protein
VCGVVVKEASCEVVVAGSNLANHVAMRSGPPDHPHLEMVFSGAGDAMARICKCISRCGRFTPLLKISISKSDS